MAGENVMERAFSRPRAALQKEMVHHKMLDGGVDYDRLRVHLYDRSQCPTVSAEKGGSGCGKEQMQGRMEVLRTARGRLEV